MILSTNFSTSWMDWGWLQFFILIWTIPLMCFVCRGRRCFWRCVLLWKQHGKEWAALDQCHHKVLENHPTQHCLTLRVSTNTPRLTLCTYEVHLCIRWSSESLCVCVSIANSSVRYTEACTSSRQSAPINPEKSSSRMPHSGSKVQTCSSSSSLSSLSVSHDPSEIILICWFWSSRNISY